MNLCATLPLLTFVCFGTSSCESVIEIPKPVSYDTPGPPPEVVMKDKLNMSREESGILIGQIKQAIQAKFEDSGMFKGEEYSFNLLYSRQSNYVWEVNEGGHGVFAVRFQKRFGRWVILGVDGGYDGQVMVSLK